MSGLAERRGPQKATPPAAVISPARAAAFELLERIAATSAHSDDLLHGPRLAGLSQVDRDLTTTLVLGVLRWQIALDARLRPLLSRPDLRLSEPVAIALRMGAFQLLHLQRIPAHAALNESVELVRAAGHPHAAGMVNALLRKLLSLPPVRKPLFETTATMAERLGHPLWLAERWTTAYGRAAAEAVCAFDQQQPGCGELFGPVAPAGSGTPDEAMPLMDAGSRLVAELAAASRPEAKRVWDCCAAPGGKTIVLGRRLPGAALLATDNSPVRLKRLAQRLERDGLGAAVETVQADAAELPEDRGLFDLILCDVPCSGTGTLARNPEIRHRLQPEELKRQATRQQKLLSGAVKHLAPGGRLLYSTCSLEPEENEAVVAATLKGLPEGLVIEQRSVVPLLIDMRAKGKLFCSEQQLAGLTRGEVLRTLPGSGLEGDGFFAALLARV
ncbi:MAG: RsmB/NOP family class I SAM-dependent RNA methyltransferase [Janthinobacterium lividum]